jgi:(p)ppGpp synthase/HD superfamily hydrolase
MKSLAGVLSAETHSPEDGRQILERLEDLLGSFEQNEIPIEQCAQATLEDPILLLLAQQRSFRIHRQTIFCPEAE